MESDRKSEIAVGITVTLALLILVFSLYWGKGKDFFSDQIELTVRFDDIHGLEQGDPVLVRGIRMGQISSITLVEDYAEVRLIIDEQTPLYSDLKITIQNREMMGGKQLVIDPGSSGTPADIGRVFDGATLGDIGTILVDVKTILANVDSLVFDMRSFIKQDRLSTTIDRVDKLIEESRLLISENREGIRSSVRRIDRMTEQIESDSLVSRLNIMIAQLDSTADMMKTIAMRVDSDEGTLGKLLRDRWLYDQLLKTSVDLDSLITDLKQNPKKYVRFSLF